MSKRAPDSDSRETKKQKMEASVNLNMISVAETINFQPISATARPMRPMNSGSSDVQHRIAMAKLQREKQLELEKQRQEQAKISSIYNPDKEKSRGGLNIAFHPALMMDTAKQLQEAKKQARLQQSGKQIQRNVEILPEKPKNVINPYLEPADRFRTTYGPKPRQSKPLKFVEPGKYIQMADKIREEEQLAKLKEELSAKVKEAGVEKELELVGEIRTSDPPIVEWWDSKLVNSNYDTFNIQAYNPIVEELVTAYIQHPVPIQPVTDTKPLEKPLLLTKQEQKKLRRQNRLEKQRDKQDRQRLGLLPQDAPKVTKQNFMRVLGQDAILAPSQIEQEVEKQVQQRQQKHFEETEAQKLTPEQLKEKKRQKLKEDTSLLVHVCVFKVDNLENQQHRFKLKMNAEQYNLSGMAIMYPGNTVIIVEGGPKGINQYKKLMLRRIDWGTSPCHLVWQGNVQKPCWKFFKIKSFPTESAIKTLLEEHNVVHYWNAAKNYVVETY